MKIENCLFDASGTVIFLLFSQNSADPNRPGLHMKLIKYLLKLQAARVVYVSCNPATCARDLDYLCHGVVCIFTCKRSHVYDVSLRYRNNLFVNFYLLIIGYRLTKV